MIRFYNARILPFDTDREMIEGELWTDGDKISYMGSTPAEKPAFEREIDLKGNLLLPGFKNAHTHSAMTFVRSYADDLPLQDWLFNKIFPLEAKLTPDAVYAFTKLANLEYLSGGVTAAFDMYYQRDHYVQACIDSGFRSVMCGAKAKFDSDWTEAERDFEKYNGIHPLIGYRLGIHAEYTANVELLRYIKTLVDAYKAPFYTHNSETESETRECIERHGCSPTALFEREGLFEYGGGGFHCVWLDENDMEIFKRRGLWAVSCPASNAKLASGVAPLSTMLDKGLNLALGTDGPSSTNALDMFREMYLASVLQKLRSRDAAAMDPLAILEMACKGGALAMGLPECAGLAVGKQADLIVIDLNQPNMRPLHNVPKNLVYSGSKSNVALTMIAGRILYEKGEYYLDESAEEIYARAEYETKKLIEA